MNSCESLVYYPVFLSQWQCSLPILSQHPGVTPLLHIRPHMDKLVECWQVPVFFPLALSKYAKPPCCALTQSTVCYPPLPVDALQTHNSSHAAVLFLLLLTYRHHTSHTQSLRREQQSHHTPSTDHNFNQHFTLQDSWRCTTLKWIRELSYWKGHGNIHENFMNCLYLYVSVLHWLWKQIFLLNNKSKSKYMIAALVLN